MLHSLNLAGIWKAHWADGQRGRTQFAEKDTIDPSRYFDATVPGEIHLDLMKAGLVPDIYRGLGVLEARWVEEFVWSYRREFDVPAEALKARGAWVVLEGVEMFARVVLNGTEVGTHANAFYPCRINVTGKLRPGKNVLCVHLDPGLYGIADKKAHGLARGDDEYLHKRFWTRRIQSQTSWDWSPRLMNCGIQSSARLEWTSAKVRADQFVPLATVSDDLQTGQVKARLFVENLTDKPVKAVLTGMLPDLKVTVKSDVVLKPGVHPVEVTLHHPGTPELWWPVGHGGQPLCKAKVTLRVDDELIHSQSKFVGFRKVRVVREPVVTPPPAPSTPTTTSAASSMGNDWGAADGKHPASPAPITGETYRFEINNRPIFCKGGNFVPCDLIGAAMTPNRYDTLIDRALEANFNFLRVWGGGQYESDHFYELCDRHGILVWQEFIFACMKYPVHDQAFYDDVMVEARYNVRRLAQHPCLIAWCGNNELETALWNWGPYDKGHVMPDYGLFHYALPRMLATEDPTRWYQPSSPISFSPAINPHDHAYGDQHPWDISFFDFDHRKYRNFICRFANEGGVLGPTSLPTMRDCLQGSDGKVGNFHWKQHDNGVDCWAEPSVLDTATELWLGKKLADMTLEQYTYFGGLIQAEGLREYCDAFRRKAWGSSAAIFWMYNDVWPCTRSWTIVDWNLNRTPSFHPVRRAMAEVAVALAEEGDQIVVYGISDGELPLSLTLRFGTFELSGKYLLDRTREVVLSPNGASPIARFPKSAMKSPLKSAAFAVLSEPSGKVVARNKLLLPLWREMTWPKAKVKVQVKNGIATFISSTFVLGVCIDLDGSSPLADNFFDLFPGQPYSIPWKGKAPPKVLFTGNLSKP